VLYASDGPYRHPNAIALFVADRAWLAHLVAWATLTFEILFPVTLFVPRLRWLFTVLIVFVNWPVVVDWVRSRLGPWRTRVGETAG